MNPKTLIILAVSAVGLGGLAFYLSDSRSAPVISSLNDTPLFPKLLAKDPPPSIIEVRKGSQTITVRRGDAPDRWTIDQRDGYPADPERVRELVDGLMKAVVAEAKTSNPEYYQRLGVADPADDADSSTLIVLKSDADAPIAGVIIGKSAQGDVSDPADFNRPTRRGVYARRSGEAQALLLDDSIPIPDGARGWMKADVLNIDQSRMTGATLVHSPTDPADSTPPETLTIERQGADAAAWAFKEMPEGRELRSPGVLQPIATVLSYVTLEDVASAKTAVDGLKPATVVTMRTREGLVLTGTLYVKDGKNWLTLASSYDPAAVVKPETPAASDPAAAPAPTPTPEELEKQASELAEKTRKESEDLNARLAPWAFQIPDFKAKQIRTRASDLLAEANANASTQPDAAPAPANQPLIFPPK
jgi:hypothetical protein